MQDGNLGRKRLFTRRSADPAEAAGRTIYLPDLRGYLAKVHEGGGWNESAKDAQNHRNFSFDGKVFAEYFEKVFCRKLQSAYFPLVFSGKVALSMKKAGCQVLASDLSEVWVENARRKGLCAIKRSFEDLPEGRFDAVVTFEPYPIITSIEGYIGIMRIIAREMAFIGIYNSGGNYWPPKSGKRSAERGIIFMEHEPQYPLISRNFERIAYDYGASFRKLEYYDGQDVLEFVSLAPTPRTTERVRLDLALLERDDLRDSVSISELAAGFGAPPGRIAAALLRLESVGERARLGFWFEQAEKIPDHVVADVSCRMTCGELRGFTRQIEIRP